MFLCFFCLLASLCDAAINALPSFLGELWVCSNLFLLNSLIDNLAETVLVNSGIADHDLLVDLVHVSLVLCVGREQGVSFLVAALVFLGEGDDGVFGDGIGELSTVEVAPVENVVVDVEGLICAAGVVVASAAALVTQDGVGKSNLLKPRVGGIFVFGFDLVLGVSVKKGREKEGSTHQDAT